MYIDEKLIKILEPHRGETMDVSYAISLIKTIAKEHETEQCDIPIVSTRTFTENQEVTYKGKKYFFKEYNPKNGKTLIANAKSVRYNDYNDWWVDSTYVC